MLAKQKNTNAGFSLIELSVWITLIAIFMSTMLSWLTPAVVEEADKITITNQRLDKIEQALENYRVRYGRLPCPASASLSDSDGEAYREYCITTTTAATQNAGTVPVKSIGLQGEDALDGWGRRFTYQVSTQLCGVDDDSASPAGDIIKCTPTRYRCGPSTGGSYTTCLNDVTSSVGAGDMTLYRSSSATVISSLVAYVIISHGPDGQCAYMPTGSRRDLGTGCAENGGADNIGQDENFYTYGGTGATNDATFYTDAYGTTVDGAVFDDIVRFKTKNQIESRTLDTYTFVLPLNPVTTPAKIGCTDTITSSANINSIYEAMNYYGTTVETNINAGITYFDDAAASYTGHASERFLGVLWTMQEICASYYPTYTRRCPDSKTYSSTYHGCL